MNLLSFRLDYLDLVPSDKTPYRPGLDRLANAVAHSKGGAMLECSTTWWPRGLKSKMAFFTANPFNSTFL